MRQACLDCNLNRQMFLPSNNGHATGGGDHCEGTRIIDIFHAPKSKTQFPSWTTLRDTGLSDPHFASDILKRSLRGRKVRSRVHMPALANRVRLVVLAVNVVTRTASVEQEVVTCRGSINGCKTKCLRVRVIAAVRHHTEAPRDWLWQLRDGEIGIIDRRCSQSLSKERACVASARASSHKAFKRSLVCS